MSGHEFALPDELGWECNDEISKLIDDWMLKVAENVPTPDGKIDKVIWAVSRAELMDDIYSIIKKYQEAKKS